MEEMRYFERFSLSQRIQHIVLMTSFILLIITGMPVLFAESPASRAVVQSMGGMTVRAALHRVAALMLIGVCVYHAFYVLYSRRGRDDFGEMIPGVKDIKDMIGMLRYYIGLSMQKPRFGRFNFIEKFEYLAMGWGSFVMVLTGLILWFEDQAMMVLPKWLMDVTTIVHSYEAVLAFLAIVIWHLYHVHLNPEVFPMSKVWLTGRISEHELKERHPLEYEKIVGRTED
ncbi:MAG: cytochrome b/b6 domain-containing protein [Armatimonadota bacterium]|nr:cytochrome b/b6 domain-containing protein [Armatimonadota bacterium]